MIPTIARLSRPFAPRFSNGKPKFNVAPKPILPPLAKFAGLEERVVYEEEKLLLFDKPSGAAIQGVYGSSGRRAFDSILEGLRARESSPEIFVVHRLDKSTTGLMLFAKSKAAAATKSREFQSRGAILKTYLAIVHGEIKEGEEGIVKDRLVVGDLRVSKETAETKKDPQSNSVDAVTKWTSLASSEGFTLLKLQPSTGRKHQLRVHCAGMGTGMGIIGDSSAESLGMGIIGDYKYSPAYSHRKLLDFPPDTILLHSYSISFHTWEKSGKRRTIEASVDPPQVFFDFAKLAGLDMTSISKKRPIPAEAKLATLSV